MQFQSKVEARIWAKDRLESLNSEQRQSASEAITRHLVSFLRTRSLQRIFMFAGKKSEPQLLSLFDSLHDLEFGLPRVRDTESMEFRLITTLDSLRPGHWGILEPAETGTPVVPTARDAVLLPAVALSRDGSRLGHGAGYYDRYLGLLNAKPLLIGVCFEELLCDAQSWPVEVHDICVEWVCTQFGVESCKRDT